VEVVPKAGRRDLLGRTAAARDAAGLEHEDTLTRFREVAGAGEAVVPPADDLARLEDEDLPARLREVAGARETVVPRTDDDDVVRLRRYSSSSILRSLPTQNVLAASQPIIGGASSAGMYRAPGKSCAGAVNVPRSSKRRMLAR